MLNMAGKVAVVTGGNKGTVGVNFITLLIFYDSRIKAFL